MEKALSLSTRRYDLDWLRVLAFGLLIFYHCGMAFVADWGYHLKNPQTSEAFQYWMIFMNRWRMPLLFMISGAGVWFSLKRRSAGQFAGERFIRLFIPLLFGMLFVVPPQIYFERLTQGIHFNNYLQFQLTVFQFKPYPEGGSWSWHHLWYLLYILTYSLLCLPLFLYWRSEHSAGLRAKAVKLFTKIPILLFALFLLPGTSEVLLRSQFPSTNGFFVDWANHCTYLLYFLMGYFLASNITFAQTIAKYRIIWLGIAITLVIILFIVYWIPDGYTLTDAQRVIYRYINTANAWAWLLTIFGFGYRYLSFNTPFLQYANKAVYPFYILHQTIIIALVYYMLQWNIGVLPKFLIAVVGTFGICFLLYEFIIRRVRLLYPFFGLKLENRRKQSPDTIPQLSAATEQSA